MFVADDWVDNLIMAEEYAWGLFGCGWYSDMGLDASIDSFSQFHCPIFISLFAHTPSIVINQPYIPSRGPELVCDECA